MTVNLFHLSLFHPTFFPFSPVFGVDLTTLVMMEGSGVPYFLQQCLIEIEKRDMSTEGMYRVSGQTRCVTHLKEDVDEGTR